jgi:cytochrome P450
MHLPSVKNNVIFDTQDIFVGGTDTTTTMIEWTMARLMQHQEVRQKVYQELQEVVGANNTVEEFHLPKLRYLDAVMKETFRLHPALPLLVPRFSGQSCTLGGYTVPKGTTVFLNVYAIHRDPNLWDNPLEFRPERFLNDDTSTFDYSGNNFQYLPFGSGRRVCAGLRLAEKMLMYLQASLLHSFEWKLPVGGVLELSDKYGIVIKKKKPLIVIPTPRLCNLELY